MLNQSELYVFEITILQLLRLQFTFRWKGVKFNFLEKRLQQILQLLFSIKKYQQPKEHKLFTLQTM